MPEGTTSTGTVRSGPPDTSIGELLNSLGSYVSEDGLPNKDAIDVRASELISLLELKDESPEVILEVARRLRVRVGECCGSSLSLQTIPESKPVSKAESKPATKPATKPNSTEIPPKDAETLGETLTEKPADKPKSEYELSPDKIEALISAIHQRFTKPPKHYKRKMIALKKSISWKVVENSLRDADEKSLWSLYKLEETGGEVDIIFDEANMFRFADCSKEAPKGRRNRSYTQAVKEAEAFGVEKGEQPLYHSMRSLGNFNTDSQVWLEEGSYFNAIVGSGGMFGGVGTRSKIGDYSIGWRGSIGIRIVSKEESYQKEIDRKNESSQRAIEHEKSAIEREISPERIEELILAIKDRFDHPPKHYNPRMIALKKSISWEVVENSLRNADLKLLLSLHKMEQTNGEVDVVLDGGVDLYFADCSKESPTGRRNRCWSEACSEAESWGVEVADGDFHNSIIFQLGTFEEKSSTIIGKSLMTIGRSQVGTFKSSSSSSYWTGWRGIVKIKKVR